MGYMDRPKKKKKKRNIERVVEYFDSHGGNIDEIANALGLSRSSIKVDKNQLVIVVMYKMKVVNLGDLEEFRVW